MEVDARTRNKLSPVAPEENAPVSDGAGNRNQLFIGGGDW
jgi:hypothetical protein